MIYLRRKADSFLRQWKNTPQRKPLVIKGARQVGKTETIRRFAKEQYKNVIEINFVEEPNYKMITEGGYRTDQVIKNISRINPAFQFREHETLIFFDEIQEFPEITTSLKFFCQDGRYDVICSGSLLGIQYKKIESHSVGYKIDHEMKSLDFEEFLWAKGYDDAFTDDLLAHMLELRPFSELEIKVLQELFLDYCILGGMPEVVREYIGTSTFQDTLSMQRQLVSDYKEDARKYAEGLDQGRIVNVFNRIPAQLAKDNKKFQISKVASGARFKDYRGCIEWLSDAGIINICYCLNFPELPLKGNIDDTKYKLYMADSGLLVSMLDEEAQADLRANKNLGVYKGALYENFVGEALTKSGYDLYYFKKENSTLEEDFFIRTASDLIPIEVKAADNRSKSLQTLIRSEQYEEIHFGMKLAKKNIGFENDIYTFPYFCAFLLKRWIEQKF